MNSIWSHRRLRFIIAGTATIVTGAALASAALAGFGALNLGPAAASQYPKKVTVCHRTHSKKHPWVQIRISTHALKAHLRHGDFVVDANHPCPPPTAASAKNKNKHHGKHSGKGKGKGQSGHKGAAPTKNPNHANGKGKGQSGHKGAAPAKNPNHANGKGKGKSGHKGAAPKKNQNHTSNKGGNGHGKK
jgi:hypothetical protein